MAYFVVVSGAKIYIMGSKGKIYKSVLAFFEVQGVQL